MNAFSFTNVDLDPDLGRPPGLKLTSENPKKNFPKQTPYKETPKC
jgi:hypothetical protein